MGLLSAAVAAGAAVAVAAVCAPVLLPVTVQIVGFGAGGIVGGSTAASIMSWYGGSVAAGSACAVLQGIGATGAAPAAFTAAANVVAGVAGCTSVGLYAGGVRRFSRRREAENSSGDKPDCGDGVDRDNSGSIAEDGPDGAAGDKLVSDTGDKPVSAGPGNHLAFGESDGVAEQKPACSCPTDTLANQMGLNPGSGDYAAGDEPASGHGFAGAEFDGAAAAGKLALDGVPFYDTDPDDDVAGDDTESGGGAAGESSSGKDGAVGDKLVLDGVPFYDTDSDDDVAGDNTEPGVDATTENCSGDD